MTTKKMIAKEIESFEIKDKKMQFKSLAEIQPLLKADFTPEECIKLLGSPDTDLGSGLYIYEYQVKEGGVVRLSFLEKLVSALYIPTAGKPKNLFEIKMRNTN